jgi:hypothetical protein
MLAELSTNPRRPQAGESRRMTMRHIAVPHVTLLTLVAVALAGVAQAQADPSSLLAGSGEFSGSETLLTFDDLGLANGDDVPSVAGVDLTLMDGNAAKFMLDGFPREIGPEGAGSVNNFWGYAFPYPDLMIRFSGVTHRLGFELRANDQDDVAVAFLASGSIVDEVTIESRGSDQLYFYGFENQAGFDEVLVDVVENASGAFTLDNLRFESLGLPEEGLPELFCMGFISPFEALSQGTRHARYAGFWKHWLSWFPMTVLRLFTPAGQEEQLDVTAESTRKDSFAFAPKGYWRLALNRRSMRRAGTYLVSMESGDESVYRIDPTCSESRITKARKRRFRR